ncbi:MAG: four helix bundle protein [Flavobacteriales bacterium]
MAIQKFEDIIAWQKAQDLAVDVYSTFRNTKDFGFRDQICRATVSISNNIAEGFDRSSNADFSRFLYISIASCSEVRSMVYLASRLDYVSEEKKDNLLFQTTEISKIIRGLIKSLDKR